MYPFAFKIVPMESVKCFHDFHHWKFKHASVDLESFAISTYKKELHFKQLQGGLCYEFDRSSFELKVFEVHFSVLIQFLVVHVTPIPKNSYMGECKKDRMIYVSQAIWGPVLWPVENKYLKLK